MGRCTRPCHRRWHCCYISLRRVEQAVDGHASGAFDTQIAADEIEDMIRFNEAIDQR